MTAPTTTANLLDQIVERAGSLYSLPAVAVEVLELTAQPRIDTRALKACVERDPALTGRLLRVVNSSLFGLSREVTDLNQALALLGVKPLKLLVLGFSLPKTLYAGMDAEELEHFWRFTLLKAVAARELSQAFWKGVGDESFIAGLLQDIGMLVLAQELGDSYLSFLHGVRDQRANLLQLETETLGFDHTMLSARLLDRWSLPASLVDAVGKSAPAGDGACLPAGDSPLPRILHLATLIASILVDDRDDLLPELLHAADRYRSIRVEQIDALLETMEQSVGVMAGLFAVRLEAAGSYREILARAHAQMSQVAMESLADMLGGQALADMLGGQTARGAQVDRQSLRQAVEQFTGGQPVRAPRGAASVRPAAPSAVHDPGLLGRIGDAIAVTRARHCELSVVLLQVDEFPNLLIRRGPEFAAHFGSALRTGVHLLCELPCECLLVEDARLAILLPNCDRQQAVATTRTLTEQLASWLVERGEAGAPLAFSAGVATLATPTRHSRADDLLEAAERCLFAAVQSGGRVVKSIDVLG
jgi:HD-like signal output (HDOD) protein